MLLRLLLIFNVVSLLSGCLSEPPTLLRIGTNIWPGYEPFYLAREYQWFQSEQIRLVEFGSAVDVMDALRQGRLEGGGLTLDEALMLTAEGIDLTVVLVCDQSEGADVVMAKPEIQQLKDLQGKRIAAETSAVGALMLESTLQAAGMTMDDIQLVSLEPREQLQAFEHNQLDAAVTFEPYKSRLARMGAHVLFSSKELPGQILDVLVVRTDALERHQQALRYLIGAHFQAREEILQANNNVLDILNRRLHLTRPELLNAYDGLKLPTLEENRSWLDTPPGRLHGRAVALADLMYRQGLASSPDANIRTTAELLPVPRS